ncbi:mechanosensitive ion channel family protein [Pelagibacterium sediminicola]|uniref:mechanosensitive ion channel family protein n=1 Tax=Pelagibacterium sediminicola TaxID=2248761 RepID=UPI000E30ECAB|nr:mechanosensitive ion channel family protein [Pelagibacterium sediminicola]
MEEFEQFTRTGEVLGNHIIVWGLALLIFLAVVILAPWVRGLLVSFLARKGEERGERFNMVKRLAHALIGGTRRFFIAAVALYFAAQVLVLPVPVSRLIAAIFLVASMMQLGLWASTLVGAWIDKGLLDETRPDPAKRSAAQLIRIMALAIVWTAILLLILSNFGVDITALIAGLGVGGIAVAFALQSVLKDLFASLSIILDKPFVVGDFIIFDEHMGTVEMIGLRTTRVRSLSGEQISVSNDALLSTRLRNFKRMSERRVAFGFHAQYGAPIDTLQAFPPYLKTIIESMGSVRFDRAHLAEFNELGARFEAVYYVLSPDYNVYMDIHQQILVAAARWFEENGLHFAQPSRRLLGDIPERDATRAELN